MRRQHSTAGPSPVGLSTSSRLHSYQERLHFLLRFAALAPSSFNTQPWAFRVTGDGVDVFADYSRRLPVVDPDNRELMMSIGAAITNFRVAAARHGMDVTVSYTAGRDEGKPVAHLSVHENREPDDELAALFPAIRKRQMNRGWIWLRQLSSSAGEGDDSVALAVPSAVCGVIDRFPATLQLIAAQESRAVRLIDFAGGGGQRRRAIQGGFAQWPPAGGGLPSAEGVVLAGPWPAAHPGSKADGAAGPESTQGASARIVVTSQDDRASLIQSGEVLERLLLVLTAAGLRYSFFSHPIELEELHARMLPAAAAQPQVLLSISGSR
jgi:hypothetical protein